MPIDRQRKDDLGYDAQGSPGATGPVRSIIQGILVEAGGADHHRVMIAIALEFCGVSALPVAVGMYLSLGSTTPIFIGGMVRLIAERLRGKPKSEAESETSPGVLLASGYIAGGTLCGLVIAFFAFSDDLTDLLNLGKHMFGEIDPTTGKPDWKPDNSGPAKMVSVIMFAALAAFLGWVGSRRDVASVAGGEPPAPHQPYESGETGA